MAVVVLLRRDASQKTAIPSPESHSLPSPERVSVHPKVLRDDPTAEFGGKVPTNPAPKSSALHPEQPEKYLTTAAELKIGRPEQPDLDALLNAASWEKFYEQCRKWKLNGPEYEDLILRRFSREMGLDGEKSDSLRKLFRAEQIEATQAIIDTCGGQEGFEKKKLEMAKYSKVVLGEFSALRGIIRQSKDGGYLRILSTEQLVVFNEHLRNSEIQIESSYGENGVHYLIGGVGKPK